jgi:hypothetical protein
MSRQIDTSEIPLVNGRRYAMWSGFVNRKEAFIGARMIDTDMGRVAETVVTDITLEPNGGESAFFTVHGKEFDCGFDVKYGGVSSAKPGWIEFHGYGGHTWRIESRSATALSRATEQEETK